ncbi:5'-nucleotidase, lipoprotein e(P4) family [Chitinophaga sp. YR573]|uniref:5'-nucleotidase, lipoprotein e(P4) family n=1 Tax=Chitinophaga sp. YR573 TaxID=1881040 RepID=UPI0008C577FD|nr:5'-nucleotidase, lipoprotein e(P4) family [Chitinophaga sp. YR573]SEV98375.1 5'-nucleotidase, lipoprotein e(P4) family [Chitinophaga sp. YR573]
MQKFTFFLTSALLLPTLSCKTVKPTVPQTSKAVEAPVPQTALVPYGPAFAALWQQQSAEYKALCFQAYNIAKLRLNERLQQAHEKPLAIVTDIDETILDNSPYTVHTSLHGQSYSDKTWFEWTAKAAADTVPGALSFLQFAASKGVHIYYITNRAETEREVTLKNLQHWHFPDADNAHLLLKTTTSGKESRRQQVAETHDIALLMGDNLSDFAVIFDKLPSDQREQVTKQSAADFGNRFIVLPNPMYGDWLPAMFQYNYKRSTPEMDSILKSKLKDY